MEAHWSEDMVWRLSRTSRTSRTLLLGLLMVVVAGRASQAAPIHVNSSTKAMMYLSQYGYMDPKWRNPNSAAIISERSVIQAIMEFQAFAGLNQTGDLDEETVKMMNTPRCGVKDKVGFGTQARKKRYALQGSRWRVKELTYKISKYPAKLVDNDVDLEVQKAFEVWSTHTDLKFVQHKTGRVHIEIRFEKGEHGDGDPFDGPGGTLAHAYFPVYGGDAHFDDSETWSINTYRGTNLFQVAAHEFGHSLGLSHSDVRSALMAPFYRGYEPNFVLDEDDVKGIQSLYGKKVSGTVTKRPIGPTTTTAKPPKLPEEDGELCNDATVDAMTVGSDGQTYAFKGNNYWKLTEEGIATGYPQLISSQFPGLPGSLDAAFSWSRGRTYFFKGSQYWRYTNMKMDSGYPKTISSGFAGIPDNIDAAFVWSGNGKIYFFKGAKFWRFDPTQRPPVKSTYPKEIKNWEGIPNGIDDALQYTNGYTYFFKGGKYWRFNDRNFAVEEANPPFPRPAGYWWFGCRSISAGIGKGNLEEVHSQQAMEDDVDDSIMDAGNHQSNGDPDVTKIHHFDNEASRSGNDDNGAFAATSSCWLLMAAYLLASLWNLDLSNMR